MSGFVERRDDVSGKYHDLLVYDRPLTDSELTDYELDFIGRETTEEQMNFSERRLFAGR